MIPAWVKTLCSALLVTFTAACGENAKATSPYVTPTGWSSICLARLGLDLPEEVVVADSGAAQRDDGGFDGIAGTATLPPQIEELSIEETGATTLSVFEAHRYSASFRNVLGRITHYEEAPTGSKYAYAVHNKHGGFRAGYFDPSDERIRTLIGALPMDKPEGTYTVDDLSGYYKELRQLYTSRKPTSMPTAPGTCTPHGFFKDPASGPKTDYDIHIAVRSLKYPNLIFFVHVRSPGPNAPRSLDELSDPNDIRLEDFKSIKGMGALAAIASLANIKKLHPPEKITIAGQPARVSAREYHHEGTLDTAGTGSGAAYEIQADAVGVQGQLDKPAITIKLAAALPDPYPYPPPVRRMVFGEEKIQHYKPARPALNGVKTPPFEEAMAYFKQVLASVRPLPQLHMPAPSQDGKVK